MAAADVFVFPSLFEGSAVVTYEALACGLPSIVTAEAGSVVRHGLEGLVVPARDVEALAEAMERLGCDPGLREDFAASARRGLNRSTGLAITAPCWRRSIRPSMPDRRKGQQAVLVMSPIPETSATPRNGVRTTMGIKSMVRGLLPRRHAPHRIFSGPLRGLRIVTSWHDYPAAICGYTERMLTDWLLEHVRPGETWLDVGANCGYTSLALCRQVGRSGHVYAFEPALATTACLERTGRENRFDQLVALPFALDDSPAPTVLKFTTDRGMIDSQMTTDDPACVAQVVAVGLDAIWDGIAPPNPTIHGIKIDVQGMELEALRGMEQCLSRYRPRLVLEIHRGVPRSDVLDLLERCGYRTKPMPIDESLGEFLDPQSNANFVFLPHAHRAEPAVR